MPARFFFLLSRSVARSLCFPSLGIYLGNGTLPRSSSAVSFLSFSANRDTVTGINELFLIRVSFCWQGASCVAAGIYSSGSAPTMSIDKEEERIRVWRATFLGRLDGWMDGWMDQLAPFVPFLLLWARRGGRRGPLRKAAPAARKRFYH